MLATPRPGDAPPSPTAPATPEAEVVPPFPQAPATPEAGAYGRPGIEVHPQPAQREIAIKADTLEDQLRQASNQTLMQMDIKQFFLDWKHEDWDKMTKSNGDPARRKNVGGLFGDGGLPDSIWQGYRNHLAVQHPTSGFALKVKYFFSLLEFASVDDLLIVVRIVNNYLIIST